jgi:hypothetical protein
MDNNGFILHRLNNQWAEYFIKAEHRKYDRRHVNFIWMLFILVFKSIWWIFKIIAVLAMIALALNCFYHWK